MELTKDTPTTENTPAHDPQKTGSGAADALGGKDAPEQSANEMSQSGEAYPGPRQGGETDKHGDHPEDKANDPKLTDN